MSIFWYLGSKLDINVFEIAGLDILANLTIYVIMD